jgi:hypothetical protein
MGNAGLASDIEPIPSPRRVSEPKGTKKVLSSKTAAKYVSCSKKCYRPKNYDSGREAACSSLPILMSDGIMLKNRVQLREKG